ncbi:hypothetical protein, partial [Pasteurella multocida]|uniref:hypothetical protein n=1 Tax=Pasteurella multocida TaxID=747 RepID=UPI00227A046B
MRHNLTFKNIKCTKTIKILSIIGLLSHEVTILSKKEKNKGLKQIKRLFDMDGLPSFDESV